MATVKKAVAKKVVTVKKTTSKKNNNFVTKVAAIGTGVAAIGAATYYLFGPNGKKHQKTAKGWATSMKAEVLAQFKKTKGETEGSYHKIVDEIAKSYAKNGKAEVAKITKHAQDLKKQWLHVQKKAKSSVKTIAKKTVKTVKKATSKKK